MTEALLGGKRPLASAAAREHSPSQRVARALDPAARDVVLLANAKAGARGPGRIASRAEAEASEHGFRVHRVGDPGALESLSAELHGRGRLRAVLAVGGDGTLGMALNKTPAGTPLVPVPAGTENLLSKYLRRRSPWGGCGGLLREGVVIRFDAGIAGGRLFALMISAGFDAEVVRQVHANRTGNITHLAYAKPILRAVRSYKYPPIKTSWVAGDGSAGSVVGRWVFGVNLPRYAQGLPIAPEATGVDGRLDLCVFERGGTAAGLWYLWNIVRRRRRRLASVTAAPCVGFRIESEVDGVPFQIDGDPGGVLPVEVTVAPERLTLLVPPETAHGFGFVLPE